MLLSADDMDVYADFSIVLEKKLERAVTILFYKTPRFLAPRLPPVSSTSDILEGSFVLSQARQRQGT